MRDRTVVNYVNKRVGFSSDFGGDKTTVEHPDLTSISFNSRGRGGDSSELFGDELVTAGNQYSEDKYK
ncbi:MAG: hypothetical protein UW35_C0011G0013 [Candidatus Collierbacteria bacterium GW2011_GWF2_44_15]|uniref:Uncharacterized protein n=1 Tax=Candidatus Collierbacteria bacterium GW2011_GWF2_44_15 TaxID=1618404 RepID=A0A0G1JRS6_9BACT|nr:MAG: hypothetical protein UW35_C0011G0013 [Candidatus Collierbacteria bacterium GW2011_GWF2_44_15]